MPRRLIWAVGKVDVALPIAAQARVPAPMLDGLGTPADSATASCLGQNDPRARNGRRHETKQASPVQGPSFLWGGCSDGSSDGDGTASGADTDHRHHTAV